MPKSYSTPPARATLTRVAHPWYHTDNRTFEQTPRAHGDGPPTGEPHVRLFVALEVTMRPMKGLTLRVRAPLELIRRVDVYARERGVTRSDAVRMLLIIALDLVARSAMPPADEARAA